MCFLVGAGAGSGVGSGVGSGAGSGVGNLSFLGNNMLLKLLRTFSLAS